MAVLQKIRNRGPLLVAVIGIALLAFIFGAVFETIGPSQNADSQRAGEVNGETVMIQDFSSWVEDWKLFVEVSNPGTQLDETTLNQIQDQAWQNYVQYCLIKKECDAVGLVVTDGEVNDIVKSGHNLLQLPVFMNQETGMYDYTIVQTFLKSYKDAKASGQQVADEYEQMYKYYTFAKKQIAQQYLMGKYYNLISSCILSNPTEAQIAFNNRVNESNILLASIPFSTITEEVEITDADLKAKYEEQKERYAVSVETRDIKVVNVNIRPSDEDDKNLKAEMDSIYKQLAAATSNVEAGNVARNNSSMTLYSNILKTKDAYPVIFSALLDSTAVGETTKPVYDAMSNTYYTFKMLDKQAQADSVLYRIISVDTDAKADSIVDAIKAGANFKELAQKYNQAGDSMWIASAAFQTSLLTANDLKYFNTIYNTNVGETTKFTISNMGTDFSVVLQVLDKKNVVTKYNVASVVKELIVSDETRTKEYNRFSSFLAANQNIDSLEANAMKEGYRVMPLNNVVSTAHNIARIPGTSEALRWVFDEAEEGEISKLFEGDANNLLVVYLSKINPKGYMSLDNSLVKQEITNLVRDEKKAEKIIASLNGVTTLEDAKSKANATIDTISHVSFAAPTFVSATTAQETLIGAVADKTETGKVSAPFKGNRGVYMLQVLAKGVTEEKFDTLTEVSTLADQWNSTIMQNNMLLFDLTKSADIEDLRYKFY